MKNCCQSILCSFSLYPREWASAAKICLARSFFCSSDNSSQDTAFSPVPRWLWMISFFDFTAVQPHFAILPFAVLLFAVLPFDILTNFIFLTLLLFILCAGFWDYPT